MSKSPFAYQIPDGYVACGGQLRVYPNQTIRTKLYQSFGNKRYVWNHFKACFDERYKNNDQLSFPDKKALSYLLTQLKREHPFLRKSDSTSLQLAVDDYSRAQWDYMKHKTHNQGRPRFKGLHYCRQTYTSRANKIGKTGKMTIRIIDDYHVLLPKICIVKTSLNKCFANYTILRATVTWRQDRDIFLLSFNGIKPKPHKLPKTGKSVGIDVGLGNEWLVLSDGTRFSVPNTVKADQKARHWQSLTDRRISRLKAAIAHHNKKFPDIPITKYEFSNWQHSRRTKAKYAMKQANIRLDDIRKAVKYLVTNYDVIIVEDLKVKNLLHNHHLAHSIANACWSEFRRILAYECDWYGKRLITVHPAYTSRICSHCGKINPSFNHLATSKWLAIRSWTCPFCHVHHDRDVNAAKNILKRGLQQL